jgi:hypothetical protein
MSGCLAACCKQRQENRHAGAKTVTEIPAIGISISEHIDRWRILTVISQYR